MTRERPVRFCEGLVVKLRRSTHLSTGIPSTPYAHQAKALDAFFNKKNELVVSTGTGSGKTESFLMPVIGSLALERELRPSSYTMPGVRALLKYICSPLALVDLAALLPPLLTGFSSDFRFLRAVRVLRMLRIWKLTRYSRSLQIVRSAVAETSNQLVAVAAILVVIVIVSAGLMYVVEHPAQPERFSSVFSSMWWTLEMLTMITYDDMAPITPMGKLLGVMIGLVGIGMFAIPAGILASAFIVRIPLKMTGCSAGT